MSSKRKEVYMTTLAKVAPGLTCPLCSAEIDSVTALRDSGEFPTPSPGSLTLCAYCGTWLTLTESFAAYRVFGVRIATRHEVDSLKGTLGYDILMEFVKNRQGSAQRG